jgi:hypothetical protein
MPLTRHQRAASLLILLAPLAATAQSLRSVESETGGFEHARLGRIPAGFGTGEFTFELWFRPDASFPVGPCASTAQRLVNWCTQNNLPYPSSDWWYDGNFLLDGHNNASFPNGTFTLQFYGGGRLRWLFGDGADTATAGSQWSVGDGRAAGAPLLLDGQWHHATLVRRWTGASAARLELWIDGVFVHAETSDRRTDMRTWWDSYPDAGPSQQGWFLLAEKQVAENLVGVIEDYKGRVDELRFFSRAKAAPEIAATWDAPLNGSEPGLVGWFDFRDALPGATRTCDRLDATRCMQIVPRGARSAISPDDAPIAPAALFADGFEAP